MANHSPAISVIVPIYNVEKYLDGCIRSLAGQTQADIEIILIDDGSPDGCGAICDQWAKQDKRITVIHQKNQGVAAARNAGLRIATGQYIGFCDPDDSVDPDYFEHLYVAGKKSGADIVKGKVIKNTAKHGRCRETGPSFDAIRENRAWFSYAFWSAIYKRRFLEKNDIKFPVGIITGQDVVFLTRAVCQANKIELVDNESHYHYFRRENSLDSEYLNDEKIQSKIDGCTEIIDYINSIELDPETYAIFFTMWLDYLLYDVIHRNNRLQNKIKIIDQAIKIYDSCKYPELYDCPDKELLTRADQVGLLHNALTYEPGRRHYKLFGIVPIMTVRTKTHRTAYRLFGFIPLVRVRRNNMRRRYFLVGIPMLTIYKTRKR